MAKRSIRKTDPENIDTPDHREASTADLNGRTAAPKTTRTRRKADLAAAAESTTHLTPMTAEGRLETPAPARSITPQPETPAAPGFTTVAEVAAVQLSHDQIAERAYHLYLERDRQPGDPFVDWVTAERELRERFVGA
jgi:hypothetical protein